jgi:hypothetical protein
LDCDPEVTRSNRFTALVHQPAALELVGHQVLVRFRHMYIRELNLAEQRTSPFVYMGGEITGDLLPIC